MKKILFFSILIFGAGKLYAASANAKVDMAAFDKAYNLLANNHNLKMGLAHSLFLSLYAKDALAAWGTLWNNFVAGKAIDNNLKEAAINALKEAIAASSEALKFGSKKLVMDSAVFGFVDPRDQVLKYYEKVMQDAQSSIGPNLSMIFTLSIANHPDLLPPADRMKGCSLFINPIYNAIPGKKACII